MDKETFEEIRRLRAEIAAWAHGGDGEPGNPGASSRQILDEVLASRAEIRTLHQRVAQLRATHLPRHQWMRVFVRDLEDNPHAQYRVHFWGAIYWLVNFPAVTVLFFLAPNIWLKWGLYITLIYSIYANFSTDYGAMSAAMAAYGNTSALPEIPLQTSVNGNGNGGGHD